MNLHDIVASEEAGEIEDRMENIIIYGIFLAGHIETIAIKAGVFKSTTQENDSTRKYWGDEIRNVIEKDENFQRFVDGESCRLMSHIVGENHENAKGYVRVGLETKVIENGNFTDIYYVGGDLYELGLDLNENIVTFMEEVGENHRLAWLENTIHFGTKVSPLTDPENVLENISF